MPSTDSPVRRLAVAAGLLIAVLVACGREITAPVANTVNAFRRYAAVSFEPKYETAVPAHLLKAALQTVAFERVRITLRREDGSIVLDTVVLFPAGSEELTVTLNVPLPATAPMTGVPLSLNLGYVNAAGDTVFRGGPVPITVVPTVTGGTTPTPTTPVQVPVQYTGTGATATSVVISPKSVAGIPGQSTTFTGRALDSGGNPIAGTPVVFTSSNEGVVTVNSTSGLATLVGRGTAKVYALLLTGPADSAVVSVSLPASQLILASGGSQTASAGSTLPTAIGARVLASDGVGVAGTTVTFAASGGGTATPASAVSDASGNVSTQWKLGSTAGPQILTITAAGLSGSPLTVNATAQAVVASKLVVQTGPVSSKAGAVLPAITVAGQDAGGNTITTFTGDVGVAIGTNAGGATLAGTTTVKAVNGVATFSDLKLNRPGTGYTLVFSSSGLASATSAGFDIVAGNAARLVFGSIPASMDAGIVISPPVTVSVQDSVGNPVTSFTNTITIGFGSNPGGATLGGTLSQAAVASAATFSNLTINRSGTAYTLTASASGLVSATSNAFNVAPGAPSAIAVIAGNGQSAVVGSKLANAITVQLRDAAGNSIAGQTLTFTPATSSGSISPSSAATAADGTASFAWTLGSLVGTQTVNITLASPILSASVTATGVGGAARQLMISRQPRPSSLSAKADTVIVQVKDSIGAVVTGSTATVTMSIASGPSGATSMGPTSVGAVAGVATFNGIAFDKAGTYTLTFASTGLTSATTSSFTVTAGWPKFVTADSGNAQTGNAGQPLIKQIIARLTDQYGNATSGRSVTWGTPSNGGTLTGTTTVTDTGGRVRANWSLGLVAGAQSVAVTAADTGLTTNSATFTATANAVAYSKLWDGSSSTSWSDTANWTPSGVPASTDSVKIGVGTFYPALSASTTVAGFSMDPTTTMSLGANALTVNGTINVQATGFSGATGSKLILGGATGSLVGFFAVDTMRFSGGTYSLSGSINVTGSLAVTSGTLNVNNGVTLSGSLDVSGTGAINQTAGTIGVGANASFGGTGSTAMTSGSLNVAGNFTSTGTTIVAMNPPHGVTFNGGSAQAITLANTADVTFSNVTFSGAGVKTLTSGSQMAITGTGFILAGSGAFTGAARAVLRGPGIIDNTAGSWNVDSIYTAVGDVSFWPATLPVKYLQLASGWVTLQNDLALPNANVVIYNGQLNPNGHALTIGKNFGTVSNGQLVMQSGTSAVTVGGNASFAGATEQGFLTAGTLTIKGNFSQSTNPAAFAASAAHTVVLSDTASSQTVSFANPDTTVGASCATSCFGTLTINKAQGTVSFLTAANAQGNITVTAATSVSAIGASGSPRVIALKGDLSTAAGTAVHFTRLFSRGSFALDTTTVIDSIGYGGTASQVMLNRLFKAVAVLGTPTLNSNLNVQGSMLVAANGVFDPNGHTVVIGDSLGVASGGRIAGSHPADSIDVAGHIRFAADAGASTPSAGKLVARADISLVNGGAMQATGTHTLFVARNDETSQTIDGSGGRVAGKGFNHAIFEGSSPKTITGGVNFVGNVLLSPSSQAVTSDLGVITGIGGAFTDSTTGFTSGGWQVDSTEFWGPSLAASAMTTKLAIMGHAKPAGEFQLNGNLTVTGASAILDLDSIGVTVMGDFATRSGGVLRMNTPGLSPYLGVLGSATFAGGSTAGQLLTGYIEVRGDFAQGGGAPDAYAPVDTFELDLGYEMAADSGSALRSSVRSNTRTSSLRGGQQGTRALRALQSPSYTETARASDARRARFTAQREEARATVLRRHPRALANLDASRLTTERARFLRRGKSVSSYSSSVHFANPCTGDPCGTTSRFGFLYLVGSEFNLDSDVWVDGILLTSYSWHLLNSTSAASHTLTTRGAAVSNIEFDNIPWVLRDGAWLSFMEYVAFDQMDPTATQFTINRAGDTSTNCECATGHVELYNWTFYTKPTTGYYVSATETRTPTPTDSLYLEMVNPSPSMHDGHIQLTRAGTNWPASFAWLGITSTDWNDGSNWSTGYAPGSTDDVTIPAGAIYPVIGGGYAAVHNLTIMPGAVIKTSCSNLDVHGNLVAPLDSAVVFDICEGGWLNLKGDGSSSNTVVGNVSDAKVYANYQIAGPGSRFIVIAQLRIDNSSSASANLTVNGGRLDAGGLTTQSGGVLTMTNAADQVFIGSSGATFNGGSTTGRLTAGTLQLSNANLEVCGECGAASDAFAPSGTHKTVFAGGMNYVNVDPYSSSYFQDLEVASGSAVQLQYDVVVHGTLSRGAGTDSAFVMAYSPVQLTVAGLNQSGPAYMWFQNVALKFVDGTSNATFSNVKFTDYGGFLSPLLEVARTSGGPYTFNTLNFSMVGELGGSGIFVKNSGTQALNILTSTPSPGVNLLQWLNTGSGSITWP